MLVGAKELLSEHPSWIEKGAESEEVADMIVLRDHNDYRDILAEAKAVGTDTAEEHGTELRPELEAAEGTNEPERSIRSFWRPALRFSTDVDVPSRVMKQPTPPSTPRRPRTMSLIARSWLRCCPGKRVARLQRTVR